MTLVCYKRRAENLVGNFCRGFVEKLTCIFIRYMNGSRASLGVEYLYTLPSLVGVPEAVENACQKIRRNDERMRTREARVEVCRRFVGGAHHRKQYQKLECRAYLVRRYGRCVWCQEDDLLVCYARNYLCRGEAQLILPVFHSHGIGLQVSD